MPTLKETVLKLDPKAEPFLANPNEVEPRRCVTWVYPPVVEAIKDESEELRALRAELDAK